MICLVTLGLLYACFILFDFICGLCLLDLFTEVLLFSCLVYLLFWLRLLLFYLCLACGVLDTYFACLFPGSLLLLLCYFGGVGCLLLTYASVELLLFSVCFGLVCFWVGDDGACLLFRVCLCVCFLVGLFYDCCFFEVCYLLLCFFELI